MYSYSYVTYSTKNNEPGMVGQAHNHATVFISTNKGGGDQLPLQTAATTESVRYKWASWTWGASTEFALMISLSKPATPGPGPRYKELGLGRGRLPTLTTASPTPWGPFPPRPNRRHGKITAGPLKGPPRNLPRTCEPPRRSPKDGWLGAPSESSSWIRGLRTLSGSPTPYGGYRATWGDARSRRPDPRSGAGQHRPTPSHKHAASQDGSYRWYHPSRVPSGGTACCPCPCHWPTCCEPASSPGQAGKDSPRGLDVQPPLEEKKY